MKKQERQHRMALTLLFTALVLVFMLITLLVVGFSIYLLIRLDVLTGPGHTVISAGRIINVFVLSALVIGAGMTFFLGKFPMKPVNKLINQMNRLAAGDYRARIDYGEFWSKHPTIAELTDSFNRMATELQSTEMLRSDFINNFSHEFKTPIVSIAGFAKLLKHEQLTPQQTEYVKIIEEESLRLSRMATNVLNLTKVENQTILTDVSTFNLSEQLRDSILLLAENWEQKELEFLVDFAERADDFILKSRGSQGQHLIPVSDDDLTFQQEVKQEHRHHHHTPQRNSGIRLSGSPADALADRCPEYRLRPESGKAA